MAFIVTARHGCIRSGGGRNVESCAGVDAFLLGWRRDLNFWILGETELALAFGWIGLVGFHLRVHTTFPQTDTLARCGSSRLRPLPTSSALRVVQIRVIVVICVGIIFAVVMILAWNGWVLSERRTAVRAFKRGLPIVMSVRYWAVVGASWPAWVVRSEVAG